MSKAADKSRLEQLHDLLATEMKNILEGGKVVIIDGEPTKVSPDAATLNAIRQFLKDNSIEAPAGGTPATKGLQEAATKLPFGADPRDAATGKAH
jgi:hypothetical protein